jgi:hypothetical protein
MWVIIFSLVSPLVAIFIALWGFRRSSRVDRVRIFIDMQERYLSERVRDGRREIHSAVKSLTAAEVAQLPSSALSNVGYALAVMNTVGICWQYGYLDEKLLIVSMGRSFRNAVEAARPFIDHSERVRGFRPYAYAERFAAYVEGSAYA